MADKNIYVCLFAESDVIFKHFHIRRNEAAIEICMRDVTDFRRPYTVLESTTAESKTSLFPILYMGTFFRASKYWPYTASNSVHHFLPNNNTNSRFPRRYKIRGDAVYWFVL